MPHASQNCRSSARGHRLHKEVIAAAGAVRNRRFTRLSVGQTRAAVEASAGRAAPDAVRDQLAANWPSIEASLLQALEVRAEAVTAGLERNLADRGREEERMIREVLTEPRRTITAQIEELESERGIQLFLAGFEPSQLAAAEREQFQRDVEALRRRVAEIPAGVTRQVEVIRRRFVAPAHRLFPAAVTFLVPESIARSMTR